MRAGAPLGSGIGRTCRILTGLAAVNRRYTRVWKVELMVNHLNELRAARKSDISPESSEVGIAELILSPGGHAPTRCSWGTQCRFVVCTLFSIASSRRKMLCARTSGKTVAVPISCKMRPQPFQSIYHPLYQKLWEATHEGATSAGAEA
jgi:hypothetical protein